VKAADVIIVGLGAMGSAAAWHLAARGQRVLGFDRFHPPHAMGSSTGRSRIIREAYWESPFYVPIVRRAYELWAELERRTAQRLLRPTGGLVIGPSQGPLVAGAIASAETHGVPLTRLTAAEVRARYPLRPGDHLAAVWEPRAGVLNPEASVSAMLAEAARAGADLRFDEPVLEWRATPEGVEMTTALGRFGARHLVLAAGAWMTGPLPAAELPLSVARQTMFWLRPRAEAAVFSPERCPVWLWESDAGPVYYGFPDLGDGPKVARHHGGALVSPETVERQVTAEEAAALVAFLEEAIPDLPGRVTDARVCLYTNTPDEHFLIDRHPASAAVLLLSPCSGHGFKFAPALGEATADWLMDRPCRFDLTPFRLSRFRETGS
jgi:sarcosine oxidase